MLSVQKILHQIQSGTDLDQVAFSEGQITFCHLRAINQIENPQFYHDLSDTVDKDLSSRFSEDKDSKGEEESHLQPTQAPTEQRESETTVVSEPSSNMLQGNMINGTLFLNGCS